MLFKGPGVSDLISSLEVDIWWLRELHVPHWFKPVFLLNVLRVLTHANEKDNVRSVWAAVKSSLHELRDYSLLDIYFFIAADEWSTAEISSTILGNVSTGEIKSINLIF